jgi:hypothetical protein
VRQSGRHRRARPCGTATSGRAAGAAREPLQQQHRRAERWKACRQKARPARANTRACWSPATPCGGGQDAAATAGLGLSCTWPGCQVPWGGRLVPSFPLAPAIVCVGSHPFQPAPAHGSELDPSCTQAALGARGYTQRIYSASAVNRRRNTLTRQARSERSATSSGSKHGSSWRAAPCGARVTRILDKRKANAGNQASVQPAAGQAQRLAYQAWAKRPFGSKQTCSGL